MGFEDFGISLDKSGFLRGLAMIERTVKNGIKGASGLTFSQYRIMLYLNHYASARMGEVTSTLELKQNTVSVAIKELEDQDMVIKQVDECDARAISLALSDAGEACLKKTNKALMEKLKEYWSPLSARQLKAVSELENAEQSDEPSPDYIGSIYRLSKGIEVFLSQENITFTQLLILMELKSATEPLRPIALVKSLDIQSNTLTAALKILEKNVFVKRETVAGQQGTQLTITAQGRKKVDDVLPSLLDRLWNILSERFDEEDIEAFLDANATMIQPYTL